MTSYKNMSTEEYLRIVFENCPDFQKMYGSFEAYLEAYARHLVKRVKELGVEDRLSPKYKAMAKALMEVE